MKSSSGTRPPNAPRAPPKHPRSALQRDLVRLEDRPRHSTNIAEDFLKNFEQKDRAETAEERLKMKLIDNEMNDMLSMSKDTRSAIREMNEAFSGDQEVEFITEESNNRLKVLKKTRRRTVDRVATAKTRALEPILEERNDEYALVPVKGNEELKKARNNSIK